MISAISRRTRVAQKERSAAMKEDTSDSLDQLQPGETRVRCTRGAREMRDPIPAAQACLTPLTVRPTCPT